MLPALRPLHGLQATLELLPEVAPSPDIHHHDQPVGSPIPLGRGLHDRRYHARRQIVYAEISGIFESLQRSALPRSGKPRNNDDPVPAHLPRNGTLLTHAASSEPGGVDKPSRLSRLAPQIIACNRHQATGYRLQEEISSQWRQSIKPL